MEGCLLWLRRAVAVKKLPVVLLRSDASSYEVFAGFAHSLTPDHERCESLLPGTYANQLEQK
jgi:hypothetical protein